MWFAENKIKKINVPKKYLNSQKLLPYLLLLVPLFVKKKKKNRYIYNDLMMIADD